jgi:hypothetical protein
VKRRVEVMGRVNIKVLSYTMKFSYNGSTTSSLSPPSLYHLEFVKCIPEFHKSLSIIFPKSMKMSSSYD